MKNLLGVAVFICFILFINHLYKTYEEHYPVADVGECLAPNSDSNIQFRVLLNDSQKGLSTGLIESRDNKQIPIFVEVSYKELRQENLIKVSCE